MKDSSLYAAAPIFPRSNKGRKLPPEIYTKAEINALLSQCSRRAPTGIRNRALIVVLWRAGLRVSEALSLALKDIDVSAGTIRVLHGKRDKDRTVGIDEQALSVVSAWFDVRKDRGISRSAPLFCTLDGKALHSAYVRGLLTRLGKRAKLEKRIHAHGLRHTHSYELHFEEGISVKVIQEQLGHSRLDTTATYLNHISPRERIEIIKKRCW